MLSFFTTVFYKFVGALGDKSNGNCVDLDGTEADKCWTAISSPLIYCNAETKEGIGGVGGVGGDGDGGLEEEARNAMHQADQSHFLLSVSPQN